MSHVKIHHASDHDGLLADLGSAIILVESNAHIKSAASSSITRQMLEDCKPPKDKFLLHAVAMGGSRKYGFNKNCLLAGAPVRTAEGFKSIETIELGDHVLTHKGRYRKVVDTMCNPVEVDIIEVKACGLPHAQVTTAEHPYDIIPAEAVSFSKLYKRGAKTAEAAQHVFEAAEATSRKFVEASAIKPGDWVLAPFEVVDSATVTYRVFGRGGSRAEDEVFDLTIPLFDPWLAGLYLAEGCKCGSRKGNAAEHGAAGVLFSLGEHDDADVIPEAVRIIESLGHVASVAPTPATDNGRRLSCMSSRLAFYFRALFGDTANSKTLHGAVFSWSLEDKLKLIAGWLDGDGCIDAGRTARTVGTVSGSTSSLDLACTMQRLIGSCGIPSSVAKGTNKASSGCYGAGDFPIYSLSVGRSWAAAVTKFCKRLKVTETVDSPRAKVRVTKSGVWFKVTKVTHRKPQQCEQVCYNLTVDEDHSFVSLVSTHNCDNWPSKDLEKRAHTFVTHGRYYREHRNRGAHENIGSIKMAAYDPEMDRVELAIWGNLKPEDGSKLTAEKEYEDAKAGKPTDVSMSARVPYDECSICGNKARNRKEYCEHAKKGLGKWHEKAAKFTYVDNPNPTFFDISSVANRADRIARTLEFIDHQKAASADANDIASGADLAELEGVCLPETAHDKIASQFKIDMLEKLATAESDVVRASLKPGSPEFELVKLASGGAFAERLSDAELKKLGESDLGLSLRKLARARAIMPFESFCGLLYGKSNAEVDADPLTKRACNLLPGVFGRMLGGSLCSDMDAFDADSGFVGTCKGTDAIDDIMRVADDKFSIDGQNMVQRMMRITITIGLPAGKPVEIVKSASHDPEAEALAVAYGSYKLAAVTDIARIHGTSTIGPRELLLVAASNFR